MQKVYLILLVLLTSITNFVHAQSVPTDLLDLSIEDLFNAEISMASINSQTLSNKINRRWHVSYNFRRLKFDGYRNGTRNITLEDVLFRPGTESRTRKNFPVVPTQITQEVHATIMSYKATAKTDINLVVPYVRQSTDHVSIIANYPAFNITSDGLGDISISATHQFLRYGTSFWRASAGLSIPTGSIDEEGDTPRAPGDQQLPYTMQLGSGTYDVPASIAYVKQLSDAVWGGQLFTKVRIGENDRDYRLGNRLLLSSWVRIKSFKWVEPSIKFTYKYWEKISGDDTDLQVPVPNFPYPAPVTDPNLFGGNQADLFIAFRFPLASNGRYIDLEISKPIYQSLNGPQSKEVLQISTAVNWGF